MNMGKKCAGTQIAHAIAIPAKIVHLALALMAFQMSLTNGRKKLKIKDEGCAIRTLKNGSLEIFVYSAA